MRLAILMPTLGLTACITNWKAADANGAESAPPEIFVSLPTLGSTWNLGEPVMFQAVVTDDVDVAGELVLSLTSSLDGEVARPLADATGLVDVGVELQAGVHELVFEAVDSSGNASTSTVTIRVIDPEAPSQPVVAIEPEAPTAGQDLHATVVYDAVDPVGFPLTYVWSWTVDGRDAGVYAPDVPGYLVDAGETWTASVVATNGVVSSPAGSRTVSIGAAPTLPGDVRILPEAPSTADELRCLHGVPTAEATYGWRVNGTLVEGAVGDVLAAGTAVRGDLVSCEVVVDDGEQSTFSSTDIRIGNAAPTVETVTLSPGTVSRADTLRCSARGVADPDLDPVTLRWRWTVDDVTVASTQDLSGELLQRGSSVRCEAIPFDGEREGPPARSGTAVVRNSAPTEPDVAFVQGTLLAGVQAQCTVPGASSDLDEDAVTYTWRWSVDGVVVATTRDTFDTSSLNVGQELTCEATPDDGYVRGTSGRASATIVAPPSGPVDASSAWLVLRGSASGGGFGKALDRVEDMDGDGLDELIVSAPRGDGSTKGAAYIFDGRQLAAGGSLADSAARWRFIGNASNDFLGGARGVAGAGDVDGDGRGDVLMAAPFADLGGTDSGSVYLLHGGGSWTAGANAALVAEATFRGAPGDWLGARLAGDDVDGDGFSDLLMSAPYNDLAGSRAGAVALFRGDGTRFSSVYRLDDADAIVTGNLNDVELGWSLDVMGDVNADGYRDVGIGVFLDDTNGTDAGTAALISGNELSGSYAYDAEAFLVVHGTDAGGRMGYDVAGLGDVDGDGLEDVAFGAYLSDAGGRDAGEVRVMFGSAGMNREIDADEADLDILGAMGQQLGSVILGLGDTDGDGRSDMMFGAPRATWRGQTSAGKAGVYSSRDAALWDESDPSPRIEIGGMAADDWLADEAAAGFDVNRDGYADFALGAQQADVGAVGGGAVWLFTGP